MAARWTAPPGRHDRHRGAGGGWRHADDDREGAIANSGTLEVAGNPYSGVATLKLAGTVTLTGGGLVSMIDVSATPPPSRRSPAPSRPTRSTTSTT